MPQTVILQAFVGKTKPEAQVPRVLLNKNILADLSTL